MAEVEIYTQPWCPYCERAMHILSTKGVQFREIDVCDAGTPKKMIVLGSETY